MKSMYLPVFEPSVKNTFPSFHASQIKNHPFLCRSCYIILLLMKIFLVCKIIAVKGTLCASTHHSSNILKEASLLLHSSVADAI
jgi:hypothetical protein